MELEKIELLDDEHKFKIKLKDIEWDVQINDKNILFDSICDLLLNYENLLFYASQKASYRTLENIRKKISEIEFSGDLITYLKDIFTNLGWLPTREIDINSTTFSGDIGELLMCILIDKLDISKTLVSKVSLKTSPKMSAYQNDNIFYDIENKILYYGESKFYSSLYQALYNAVDSLNNHSGSLVELSFIRNHSSTFIADDNAIRERLTEELENVDCASVSISSITFVMASDKYNKKDVEDELNIFISDFNSSNIPFNKCYVVIFPILDKEMFLKRLIDRISTTYEQE